MPIALYSLLCMITAAIASLMLFIKSKQSPDQSARKFFLYYAFGFAILACVNIPTFIMKLGLALSYNVLLALYAISFACVLISYGLFYRASLQQFIKSRFLTIIFPFVFLPSFALLVIISFLTMKANPILVYSALLWGFLVPLDVFLATLFLRTFYLSISTHAIKSHAYSILLGLGWLTLLFVDIWLWWGASSYPDPNLWIIEISNATAWFVARSASYLLILAGALLSHGKHQSHPEQNNLLS